VELDTNFRHHMIPPTDIIRSELNPVHIVKTISCKLNIRNILPSMFRVIMRSLSFSALDYYFVNNYIPRYACHMMHEVYPQFLYFSDETRRKTWRNRHDFDVISLWLVTKFRWRLRVRS